MKKTAKEFVEKTGMSMFTVRRIFQRGGIQFGDKLHPATMEVVEFNRIAKEMGTKKRCGIQRARKSTVASVLFDYATKIIEKKYESMKQFFEETGFERRRWYGLSEGIIYRLSDNEDRILRELLNV